MTDRREFIELSVMLTGFDSATLEGTGCVDEYHEQFSAMDPSRFMHNIRRSMRDAHRADIHGDDEARDEFIRSEILADPDFGPLARSLIQLWYLGQWVPMPQDWVDRNGARLKDTARILSLRAYREGLAWVAMGAHPQAAKQQGFGAWALEPPQPDAGDA